MLLVVEAFRKRTYLNHIFEPKYMHSLRDTLSDLTLAELSLMCVTQASGKQLNIVIYGDVKFMVFLIQ